MRASTQNQTNKAKPKLENTTRGNSSKAQANKKPSPVRPSRSGECVWACVLRLVFITFVSRNFQTCQNRCNRSTIRLTWATCLFAPFLVHFHGFFSRSLAFFPPEWWVPAECPDPGGSLTGILHITHINLKVKVL